MRNRFGTSAAVLASIVLIAGVLALTAVMVPERERAPSVGAGGS
ncbi:hypothetical protein ACFOWZ_10230 [Lentzea rhizosphaerae]|uniref:Uncharacterized protein n=1 Tax=Lentzea rhizosphaerae TaxID=2041025 RepID=A0ABV8BNP6_9PSEU